MTRTKSMTHFYNAATGYVEVELKVRGLADTLFNGVQLLVEEHGLSDLLSEFEKSMIDAEKHVKDKLPDGVTLSEYSSSWKVRKSELKRAIKSGLDPTKYENYRKFIDAVTKPNADGKGKGKGNKVTSSKPDNTPNKVESVTSNMPEKVRTKLNSAIKALEKLDEATALEVLGNFEGAIYGKLRKAGGRYANVKQATK